MRKTDNPNMPPPAVLKAIRQPRRGQLNDPRVKKLLAEWKARGWPIDYFDLGQIAKIIGVEHPAAPTRKRIVKAVEAAGVRIDNYDSWRQTVARRGNVGCLSARGWRNRVAEQYWRWPEKWDKQQRRQRETCYLVRRNGGEYILKHKEVKPGDEVLPWPDWEERWL